MSEPKPKKMVSRNVAVALGIICVFLAAALVVLTNNYISTMRDQNNVISSLQIQYNQTQTALNEVSTMYQQERTWLQDNITYFTVQIVSLTNILNGGVGTYWVNNVLIYSSAGTYFSENFTAPYAGFIQVFFEPSPPLLSISNTTYIRVRYAAYPSLVNYDNQLYSITSAFPVLPSQNIEVTVGDSNPLNQVHGTLTVIYYY